jgi:hypothetical protein
MYEIYIPLLSGDVVGVNVSGWYRILSRCQLMRIIIQTANFMTKHTTKKESPTL